MKGLDTLLAEAIGKMRPATLKKYNDRTNGKRLAQENLVNVAESLLAQDGESSERQPIRRNNGASGPIDETARFEQESEKLLNEAISARDPEYAKSYKTVTEQASAVSGLTESQRREYDFCIQLQMNEADALKVARLS